MEFNFLYMDTDRYYEHYWLSFKKSLKVSDNLLAEIEKYSSIMNSLQKEKRFAEILLIMKDFFDTYACRLIAESYIYSDSLGLLNTNIKRFEKWYPVRKDIEFAFLATLSNYEKKYCNKLDPLLLHSYFMKCIKYKYTIGCLEKYQHDELLAGLNEIIADSIANNAVSMLVNLSSYVNLGGKSKKRKLIKKLQLYT